MTAAPFSAVINSNRIFIGHGRSEQWRILKDFVRDKLGLEYEEFNRISAAGLNTQERLRDMLDSCGFAFLIMTAEDLRDDGTFRARENVVHECGLFQGRLGWRKAIVLLEDGCEEFSNIIGLGQIRFPKGNIAACFEQIRDVLKRESLIEK
ncbi:TIR domain-containing protein [Neorhizobium sp. T7_12]|uniref:TIR domain-containing protein n=1 Tax=Neorhizobium sp. T7_12 TaxID=2093832 RepID=UPI00197DD425|nr:nucleotide-binding protein [Neorhizobium sp. T7_12]